MTDTYPTYIQRGSPYDQSYDVYAKLNGVPIESGDGIYMGNFPIDPDEDVILANLIVPTAGTWGFMVCAICSREVTATMTIDPA